jgi:hypothetical protein
MTNKEIKNEKNGLCIDNDDLIKIDFDKEGGEFYDEELETLARVYTSINNETFGYIDDEDIKKLRTITGEVSYDIEKIVNFLKEKYILKEATRGKNDFWNIFYFRKKYWENSILIKMAQKLSIPKEEEKEFISYIKDYFSDNFLDREDITEVVKNKRYLNYNPQVKINAKKTRHYV